MELYSNSTYSDSMSRSKSRMYSTIVVLLLLMYVTGGELSCEPCECFTDLKEARCDEKSSLTAVPSRYTLPGSIRNLYIKNGSISSIKQNQFISFQELKIISITDSKVSLVESHAFRDMKNLTKISLVGNLITDLPTHLFSDTPNLVDLQLYSNNLKVLQTNLFSNLKYLTKVWLSSNQITNIEANCFVNVPLLESIDLFDNKLTVLRMNIIDNLASLDHIILHGNPWHCDESLCELMKTVVKRELWGRWDTPTCVTPQSLQRKPWSELEEHALLRQCHRCTPCSCEKLTEVRCTDQLKLVRVPDTLPYTITHLHFTDQETTTLHNNAFSTYGQLQELYLERNQINIIESNSFQNLKNLSVLSLAQNSITKLDVNSFSSTPNLTKLLLNNNHLTGLQSFQFSNLVMMKEIDLSYNNISFIEKGCFVNVSSLRIINLRNNQLQTLQFNIMDDISGLVYLYLGGNPWRCDESLCGVLNMVVESELWGSSEVPTCAAPPSVAGMQWPQLQLKYFQPEIMSNVTSVQESQDVTLRCRYCFVSRVTWTFNGIKLSRSQQQVSVTSLESSLTLRDVRREHQGYYVCHVDQCQECEDAWLHLNVHQKPEQDVFEMKQVFHITDNSSSSSNNTRRGLILLQYLIKQIGEPATKDGADL